MSHQTGIVASDDLKHFLGNSRDGRVRVIKVSISSSMTPRMELDASEEQNGSWEEDWDCLLTHVEADQPAYFLYRYLSISFSQLFFTKG